LIFAYALVASLATPALLFAAGGQPHLAAGQEAAAPSPSPKLVIDSTAPSHAAAAKPRREKPRAAKPQPATPRAVAHAAGSDTIKDFSFSPATVTVTAGETITWTNDGPTGHSATADDGSFDTGILSQGHSGSHTFTTPGTYSFHCTPHPFMQGKVVVLAAAGSRSSPRSSGSTGSSGATNGTTAAGSTGTSGTSTGTATSGGLPNTGSDTGAVALVGIALLSGGMLLRRRVRPARSYSRSYSPSSRE
jgi:LPXTG-motif cell wall-anchored protein